MRMINNFEAYLDDYDLIIAFMKKNFYKGKSKSFYLKDEKEGIIHLKVNRHDTIEGGYTKFTLGVDPSELRIGAEYTLYNEYGRPVICEYGHIVKTDKFYQDYLYEKDDLGCTYTKEKTVFKVWSPIANRMKVNLKKGNDTKIIKMNRSEQGVFEAEVNEDIKGYKYTYLIRVNGVWNETVDPYTSFSGPNGKYSVVLDKDELSFPEKIEMEPLKSNVDAIIYEASIRDMTSQKKIGVENPKTFVGFTEENATTKKLNTGFSYLKSLGITHVQLMPVYDFGSVDEIYTSLLYNWGYDPMQYRCFEGSYSLDPSDAGLRVIEFANLVKKCHENGIKVNLDVVFNHVYDKDNFALEKIVPNYYFLMDREGKFSDGSFCGNDIDTRAPMCSRYFLSTVKRLIEWFDIDGLRFDLMGILDVDFMNKVTKMCQELKPGFMIYGEGWNMPSFVPDYLRASQLNQDKMDRVGHFSDRFRETIRGANGDLARKGFIEGRTEDIYLAKSCMMASCLDYIFDSPEKVVNYVECHDNHTLWDKLKACCKNESEEVLQKRQILGTAMVLLAQGIPFIHSGQEFGRTKKGTGNSYNKSDSYNLMDYTRRDENQYMVDAFKTLVNIRKEHSSFRSRTTLDIKHSVFISTILDRVLVYDTRSEDDHCISFFNPTNEHYNYIVDGEVDILYDSGKENNYPTHNVQIAPYSTVVCHFKKD